MTGKKPRTPVPQASLAPGAVPANREDSHEFEGFTLDHRRGCLRAGDREIELRPKGLTLLRYLVENAGRLVSKEELIGAVWPNVTVSDESLKRCISDVRRALHDQAQRIIKTMPRRGYRFAAAISQPAPAAAPVSRASAGASPAAVDRDQVRAPAAERRTAERRQLTVLACELVGLAALSTRLDLDELQDATAACQRRFAEIIGRHHGHLTLWSGDSLLAYFGHAEAREYDAEHAVQAALALVESLAGLPAAAGVSLTARVGIATGAVVVRDLAAGAEPAVVGGPPNLAVRLRALARPGAVVISSDTRDLIGGLFEYRDLGTVTLEGLADAVPAWQVLAASAADSRFEALRTPSTPFVNRDEEIDLILRRWERAKDGDGSVVLLSGEPGIGKSRIAETILERLSDEPHNRLRYSCSPHHQDSALYPVITRLEQAAGFRRDDKDEQRLEKLEASLALATDDFGAVVPALADLLSVPTGGRYPALGLTPQKRKEKTLRALVAAVEGLAARQPLLIVCEDVHWCDPTTRELLDLVIDRVATLRVLLIITFRPEFKPPWVGQPQVTLLSLSRLSPRHRAEMIARLTGDKVLPKEIADEIVDRTDGVPLFVEELTRSVVESGQLVVSGDRYVVRGPAAPVAIPTSLQASLLVRLDRLPEARGVVQTAAALGRRFSHEMISAVAAMPQAQLDDALERLVRTELIFRRGTPPDAEYAFKHALVQDAAYGTMLRGQRQQRHAEIAAALEQRFPEVATAEPELLARHCTEAGLAEKAVGYWLRAGQQALARSAMREAVARLRKGLEVLAGVPEGDWRWQTELDLQMALRPALSATTGSAAAGVGEAMARARALAERLGRTDCLAALGLGQWMAHFVRAEHRLALAAAEQIEKMGEAHNAVAVQLQGRRARGATLGRLGEFVASRDLLERCEGLRDPAHRAVTGGMVADVYVQMLGELAQTLAYLGHVDQARQRLGEALAEARRLEHVNTLAAALGLACMTDWVAGSPDLRQHAEEMLGLAEEHGLAVARSSAMAFCGAALTRRGEVPQGVELLSQALTMMRAVGWVFNTPDVLMMLAEAHAALGQADEGLRCLAEAQDFMETHEERRGEAGLHRLRGGLLAAAGDQAAAGQSYRRALAIARSQSARLLELRASLGLARLWLRQGKCREARDLLVPICRWFAEATDLPVLAEAKALLKASA